MRFAMIMTACVLTVGLASQSWAQPRGPQRTRGHSSTRSTSSATRTTTALPMNPMAFWQGVANASLQYQKGMTRALQRYNFMRGFGGSGPARAGLANDAHSAYLGANAKFWKSAAKNTPWGAMLKASAAPFYTPFGGLRVPTPVQYWTGVMQSLQSSSRSASSAGRARSSGN